MLLIKIIFMNILNTNNEIFYLYFLVNEFIYKYINIF